MSKGETMFLNYSNAELFKLSGTLPSDRIETLLDCESKLNLVADYKTKVQEAYYCFISEGFADNELQQLKALCKSLRGNNRSQLENIIESLENTIASEVSNAAYGRDELRDIIK